MGDTDFMFCPCFVGQTMFLDWMLWWIHETPFFHNNCKNKNTNQNSNYTHFGECKNIAIYRVEILFKYTVCIYHQRGKFKTRPIFQVQSSLIEKGRKIIKNVRHKWKLMILNPGADFHLSRTRHAVLCPPFCISQSFVECTREVLTKH